MNVVSGWIIMAVFVSVKRKKVEHLTNAQNIQLKFTYGVGYHCEGQYVW